MGCPIQSGRRHRRSVGANLAPTEREVQRAIVQLVRVKYPHVEIGHIPNGTRTSINTARKMVGDGVLKGAPDLFLVWNGGVGFFEVKRPGGRVSHEQRALIGRWRDFGVNVAVVTSVDSADACLQLWGAR